MNDGPKVQRELRILTGITLAGLAAFLLVAVVQRVALYADGAYMFYLTVGERHSLVSFTYPRASSDLLLRGPLWLALHLDIDGTFLLELIFGFSVFSHFILMFVACKRASKQRPLLMVFPITSLVLLSANMGFWPFTGSHVVVSLFWSLLYVTVLPEPWTLRWTVLAVILAIFATCAYESMLGLGPILVIAACWRTYTEVGFLRRAGALLVALLCLTGVGVALYSVLGSEAGHYVKSSVTLVDPGGRIHGMQLLSLWALVLLGAIVLAGRHSIAHRTWNVGMALLVAGCVFWIGACLFFPERTITVSVQHSIRGFNLWSTLGIFGLFLVACRRDVLALPNVNTRVWRLLAVMAFAQTASLAIHAAHWNHFLQLVDREVSTTKRGPIPYEDTSLSQRRHGRYVVDVFTWGWTMPLLSLLSARDGSVRAIIANPTWYSGFAPLMLADTLELRDPTRYGYRFDEYLRALPDSSSASRPSTNR